VARCHAAVVRRARPIVQRRLRAVHRRPAARRPVHRRAGRAVGRRLVVGGDAAAAARAAGAHHRYAGAVHRDGLALGVQLHAGRRFGRVLEVNNFLYYSGSRVILMRIRIQHLCLCRF
jgi:hypothetical protein